jgi:hypothetical protein
MGSNPGQFILSLCYVILSTFEKIPKYRLQYETENRIDSFDHVRNKSAVGKVEGKTETNLI